MTDTDYGGYKQGERVRYIGRDSRELINALGTIADQSENTSQRCVHVLWDDHKPFGVYPRNLERVRKEGRNKL